MIKSEWKKLIAEERAFKEAAAWADYERRSMEKVMAEHNKVEPPMTHNQDIINAPNHYKRWAIEPIEFTMRNNFEGWRSNCTKYICRAGFKLYEGKTKEESEIIDLRKNIRYSEARINQLLGKDKL